MRCPFCRTENRNDRENCYYCKKDLAMLRLIVNKARAHFNTALELAERDRNEEAIAELHNALDLDHSHINSHVVLGTLYAKIGDLQKAEESWNAALCLDSRLQKAHDYIEKGKTIRRSLPIIHRQRIIIVILVLVVLAAGLLDYYVLQRNVINSQIQDAWQAYLDRDYGTAIQQAAKVRDNSHQEIVVQQASVIMEVLKAEQDLLLRATRQYIEENNLTRAYATLKNILGSNPPQSTRVTALRLQRDLENKARENLRNALDAMAEGKKDPDEAGKTLDTYASITAEKENNPFLVKSRDLYSTLTQMLVVEDTLTAFQQGDIDEWQMLENLVALNEKYPQYQTHKDLMPRFEKYPDFSTLPELIRTLSTPLRDRLSTTFNLYMAAREFNAAEQNLKHLKRLADILQENGQAKPLQELEKQLADARAQASEDRQRLQLAEWRTQLEKAETSGDLAGMVDAGKKMLQSPLMDQAEKEGLQNLVQRAQRQLAIQRWTRIVNRDLDYQNGRITLKEARETIDQYPQIANHLPETAFPNAQDNLLMYRGLAHRRLGQFKEAREDFQKILEAWPQASVAPLVERFLKKLP